MDTTATRKIIDFERARSKSRLVPHVYYSILFANPGDRPTGDAATAPDFFTDLNCDQIVNAITAGKVPGKAAKLFLYDQMFTHFEKEEKVENSRGKLEDDLLSIHHILGQATPQSIVIMNEIFTSTTIQDETFLSKKVMEQAAAVGLLCVWVTFVDELALYGPQTVSMTSTVAPDNPVLRTFKVVRRAADGFAYAMAIAENIG